MQLYHNYSVGAMCSSYKQCSLDISQINQKCHQWKTRKNVYHNVVAQNHTLGVITVLLLVNDDYETLPPPSVLAWIVGQYPKKIPFFIIMQNFL